jgi:hypothetical protein
MATGGSTRGLQPFTKGDNRASELGKRGAAARKAKREATQLVTVRDASVGAELVDTLTSRYDRDKLGGAAAAAVQHLIANVTSGAVPIKDATDAANLIRVLFDVARLEEGQSTSNIMHGSVAMLERIESMRAELAAAANSAPAQLAPMTKGTESPPA